MDVVQFHIALSIYNEFLADGVSGLEYWRDCAGSVHFAAVHDGKVVEASVYMDEESYLVFSEHIEDDVEDEEEEESDEESEEEESSEDEEYVPKKRQRRQ